MLTVMHRHDDGTETLYQAEAVTRFCVDEPTIPALGNVILRGCPEGLAVGPGATTDLGGNIQIQYGCRSSRGFDPMVFVMNEKGATVATYRL